MTKSASQNNQNYAIRFGLGAIKSVGLAAMESAVLERKTNGKFLDIFDFAQRIESKSINKKSIEALAKSGAFDSVGKNRQQIANSYEILVACAAQSKRNADSSQMSLFGSSDEFNKKPELKKIVDWNSAERLQMEFEAFGYFLNEHPLDDSLSELKLRGVIFSEKIEEGELEDGSIVKLAGVVASSKHRSGPKGRFAYIYISDPFGMFEATIFDEKIITENRDILSDGSVVVLECLIRKGEGGSRIMIKNVSNLYDFIRITKPSKAPFEDIKKQPNRSANRDFGKKNYGKNYENSGQNYGAKSFDQVNRNQNEQVPRNQNSIESNFVNSGDRSTSFETISQNKSLAATILQSGELCFVISDKSAILPLKTILAQKQQKSDLASEVKITLIAKPANLSEISKQKAKKILLNGSYFLSEIDILRFQNLHPKLTILKPDFMSQ